MKKIAMRKARFTEYRITAVLKSVAAGRTVKDVYRGAGIYEVCDDGWKIKYGAMEACDIKTNKKLEDGNRRLKRMFSNLILESGTLQDVY
ncbi:transposase [Edwardsiella ictaluri]|nr:transposase [Edwardsiella ictaluri]WJH19727.1 transposase [Edwardsiella ictaluri]